MLGLRSDPSPWAMDLKDRMVACGQFLGQIVAVPNGTVDSCPRGNHRYFHSGRIPA
jgi:hypothetical protein